MIIEAILLQSLYAFLRPYNMTVKYAVCVNRNH